MFNSGKKAKNYLNGNELIINAMLKRRRFAAAAISSVCNTKTRMRIVK